MEDSSEEKSGGKRERETTAKTEKVNDKGLNKMKRDRGDISKRDRQIERGEEKRSRPSGKERKRV